MSSFHVFCAAQFFLLLSGPICTPIALDCSVLLALPSKSEAVIQSLVLLSDFLRIGSGFGRLELEGVSNR